jgi:predicted  nucleic acid-binding Zn-ribbon protein
VTRLRDRNEELEARAVRHAARLEQLDDDLTAARRRIRTLEAEHEVQAGIIRRRNAQIVLLGETLRRQVLAYLALSRVRDVLRPAPGPIDTGTPGVYAAVRPR